jgi:hypothetical protein
MLQMSNKNKGGKKEQARTSFKPDAGEWASALKVGDEVVTMDEDTELCAWECECE